MSEERTELGVNEVREHNGMIEVDCWHPCYDEKLILKFPYCQLPKPDTPEAVSLSPETLQGLIDFAHTATHSINRYRSLHSYNMEYAKHWDDLKKLGKPSWDK
jgi:hypothetical protein